MEQEKTGRGASRRSSGARSKKATRGNEDRETPSKSGAAENVLSRIIPVAAGEQEKRERAGADPVEMLRRDHEMVRQLFEDYESAGEGSEERKEIVDQISLELQIHAELEEKIFYQAFREASEEEPQKVVRESFEEHKIVKTLLRELAPMKAQDPQFHAKVTVLKENVEHHVEEEEDELLPAARKIFGRDRLSELGAEMMALKEELRDKAGMA